MQNEKNKCEKNKKKLLYPFQAIICDDSSLFDQSFQIKQNKKLNFFIEEMQRKNTKIACSSPKKKTNSKINELLKQRLNEICQNSMYQQEKNMIPSSFKTSNKNNKKSIIFPNKIQFSTRKATSFSVDTRKKFLKNKSLALNEPNINIIGDFHDKNISLNHKQIDHKNYIVKQKGLADEIPKKCGFNLRRNESIYIDDDEKISENTFNNQEKNVSNDFSLSIETLAFIKSEFQKPEDSRKIVKLDSHLQHLYYFKKFSSFYRRKIFRFCEFFEFQQNEIIFRQGDPSDYVYIILRGAVSIQV